jgi:hypothetical protein
LRNFFSSEIIDSSVDSQLLKVMSTTSFFTLFESASGWALFSILEAEEIGALVADVSPLSFCVLLLFTFLSFAT